MKSVTLKLASRIALLPLATVAAVLVTHFGALTLSAGEPIQFSREKPRPSANPGENSRENGRENGRLSKEAARQSKGLVPNNSVELLPSFNQDVQSRDPRDERRRKTAHNETKNWMFHERGEGRDREEDDLGIRDYSLEKDDGTADSIFAPKGSDSRNSGRPRLPSSLSRLSSQEQDEPPPARPPEPAKEAKRPGAEDSQREQTGDHVSKDLDLRTLLGAGKSSAAKSSAANSAEQTEAASRNTRAGDPAVRTRDDQERRRGDLNVAGSGLGGTKSAGLGDAPGAGINAGAPRATPSSFPSLAPRSSELNNPLDRSFGGGLNSSRSSFDSGFDRTLRNPNSLYPPTLSEPYYNTPNSSPSYGSQGQFGQRPPQNTAPSQSTWDRSRIPRP